MKSKLLAAVLLGVLLLPGFSLTGRAQAQTPAPSEGIYFVAHRTQSHILRSSPDVFHRVANDLIAYLKSRNVKIIEDPERGILQTDEAFSVASLLNLTKNAGATSLLLVTVDRPVSKWLKVTVQAYDLNAKLLWSQEVSSGGGLSGGGAPAKVLTTLGKKLDPRIGKPGLPVEAQAPEPEPQPQAAPQQPTQPQAEPQTNGGPSEPPPAETTEQENKQ
jgi:hypothetical protein